MKQRSGRARRIDHDLVVVGAGAGGLVAAREARRRGANVAIVADGPPGGDCTFTGCIPSKALLAAAARGASFDEAMASLHRAVARIAATEDAAALAREGIVVIDGFARFADPRTVVVDGRPIRSSRFVVATGAKPLVPPIAGLREIGPLTSDTLFSLAERPRSLAILGAGPMGCEMAQAFARLGVHVTLIEALDRVLAAEEPDTSAAITGALADDGVTVRTAARVVRVDPARRPDGDVTIHTDSGDPVVARAVLVAFGRSPSGRGFGLEELGVTLDDRGAVVVEDTMATTVGGIWAAGDVVGRAQFTHAAAKMGWIAAANALSRLARARPFRFDDRVLPRATFTSPEVGRVGLTEAEAARLHPGSTVAHLPLDLVDRAVAVGAERGFVKLIAAPRRGLPHPGLARLVGATVVAPTGGDVVHEAALAMQTHMFVGRLAQTSHAYPTWAAAIQQAALQFVGTFGEQRARPAQP